MALLSMMVHGKGTKNRAVTAEGAFDGFEARVRQIARFFISIGEMDDRNGGEMAQGDSPRATSPPGWIGGGTAPVSDDSGFSTTQRYQRSDDQEDTEERTRSLTTGRATALPRKNNDLLLVFCPISLQEVVNTCT